MLNKHRVVIVGGTSGIGLATAQAFINEAAQVIIASRSLKNLEKAKQELNGDVEAYELDFREEEKVAEFFERVGRFDHLIITAGEGIMGDIRDLPIREAHSAFDSKFWGQYIIVKAAIPYLNEKSSITLTSGIYATRPPKGASLFAAVNSAIEGLMRGLTLDLAPIRINVVSPGLVETPMYAGLSEEERTNLFSSVAKQLPVGHIAQPEDIAETYVFLAKNGFTTGSVVIIDGGALLS